MATFTSFSDLLPDPNNKINTAGASDAAGNAGPGFAKVTFRSSNLVQSSRTVSGRGVTASLGQHKWEFDISYNPLTRADFEPVSTFLETRQGGLLPFYVILPQHSAPQDPTFSNYVSSNTLTVSSAHSAGSSTLTIQGTSIQGNPKPGDFFTIDDSNDVNHKKAYKVTRVETPSLYQEGKPVFEGTRRIHIQPPLVRDTAGGSIVNFKNPKFRVMQKGDTLEYNLDTDNLYQFSLSLEEIQP